MSIARAPDPDWLAGAVYTDEMVGEPSPAALQAVSMESKAAARDPPQPRSAVVFVAPSYAIAADGLNTLCATVDVVMPGGAGLSQDFMGYLLPRARHTAESCGLPLFSPPRCVRHA
jgi:hypothetical protein